MSSGAQEDIGSEKLSLLAAGDDPAPSEHHNLLLLTRHAFQVAAGAAARSASVVATHSAGDCRYVAECERQLDDFDRELDQRVTGAIISATAEQARDLLGCLKIMTDLERIGDLVLSFASRGDAVGRRLDMEDVGELIRMASVLEHMIVNAGQAFVDRNLELALDVLRADAELDRLRNLICIRHLEGRVAQESVQVLFMAQALERAGDHAKNLAEEICHRITGHSLRHARRSQDTPQEQMFVRQLRRRNRVQA